MELAFEQKQASCLRRTAHLALAQEQTQELIIPDSMPDASRTLICYAQPELQSKTSRAGSLLVTGNLRTSCLYADETGGVQLLTAELPFTVKLESADLQETTQTVVRCTVRSADSRPSIRARSSCASACWRRPTAMSRTRAPCARSRIRPPACS